MFACVSARRGMGDVFHVGLIFMGEILSLIESWRDNCCAERGGGLRWVALGHSARGSVAHRYVARFEQCHSFSITHYMEWVNSSFCLSLSWIFYEILYDLDIYCE